MLIALVLILACNKAGQEYTPEKAEQEIREAEQEFAEMVANEGIAEGFIAFAAEDAVLKRGDSLIIGKPGIADFLQAQPTQPATLQWTPDHVEVSASGDLGYTYGRYTYAYKDSLGNEKSMTGIFHTVWKKQEDGSWKYVWD